MKRRLVLLVLSVQIVCSFVSAQSLERADTPMRVLFIGNSYTYFNNMPGVLTALSESKESGPRIITEMVVAGGATLKQHFEGTKAVSRIREGNWDFVVLQEQSTLGQSKYINGVPAINDPGEFYKYARLLHTEITKQGAQTVFMLTWARKASPQYQADLTDAYMTIGRELGARVAPVGLVWERVIEKSDGLKLFMEDGSHPSAQGTYLAACVIYETITGKSPVNLPCSLEVSGINMAGEPVKSKEALQRIELIQKDATLIQEKAWSIYTALEKNGGYVEALPVQKPQEPSVPQGMEFTGSDLIDAWEGTAFLGLTPDPTELTLDIFRSGESMGVKIELDFRGVFVPDQSHEARNVDLAHSHLRFSHPLKMTYEDTDALLNYDLVFKGGFLSGVVRMFFGGEERGISEVKLHRRQ